jgi:hypothetical protein
MKKTVFGCWGHAFNRKIFFTKDGKYNEMTVSGGVALIQQLLSFRDLTQYTPLDDTYRCAYVELRQFEDKKAKKTYYAVDRRLGFTDGITTPASGDADYAVVLDEGFGEIAPPIEGIPVLWASNKRLPDKAVFDVIAGHCFLMLDADVLRNGGAMISSRISWERSATELVWQLQNNPVLSYLLKTPHLLITFAEDGAVYVRRENGNINAFLVLAHGDGEGSLREKIQGTIDDSFVLMTTALALQLPEITENKKSLRILPVLKSAEDLLNNGYSLDRLRNGQFDISTIATDADERWFEIPHTPGQNVIDYDFWCISNNVNNKRIFDIACEYVQKGSQVITGFPQLTFGALTTIDRREIESFRNIGNLIFSYLRTDSVRPLSIAVFGAPGSGKSFGVTQIAKNILPGKVEKLEFNVSQFTNNADLGVAFQKVRDVTLEGKLPLVFFDEFDSDREGIQLGWVKNFLMPMQDGKFKDESGEHPLGKCILVFAGGTSASFEEFCRPMLAENTEERKKFKDVKGPDFVSRLRGTINILGPNQFDATDKNYILRRALLLRSLCERKLKMKKGEDAPISANILWAMLLVPKYKHGARSMEAILDMSRIEGNVWEPVSLPFYSQLSLHVDADAFIRLVLREVILNTYVEKLAIAIHEDYRQKNPVTEYDMTWEELPEHIKESNRIQARFFGYYLKEVGCDFDAGDTPFPSVEHFSTAEIEKIAIAAHVVWMKSKKADGWIYGEEKDPVKKTHPCIVEWKDLPDAEKQKDRDIAENIIPMMEDVGLRVYRVE